MGKRVRFFIYGNDELILLNELKKITSILILKENSEIADLKHLEDDLLSLYFTEEKAKIVKWQDGSIDPLISEVIHFIRCRKENEKQIWEGGIWFENKFYDDKKQLVKKPEWLNEKFNICKKWITKNLKINKDKDCYIGEEAYKLYKEKGFKMKNAPKVNIDFD